MSHNSVEREIAEIFEDVMDLDDFIYNSEVTADDIEEWDSLSHVRLIVSIERHFKIKLTNSEVENLKKLGDIATLISEKTSS